MRRLLFFAMFALSFLVSSAALAAPEWISLDDGASRAGRSLDLTAGETSGQLRLDARFDGLYLESVDTELGPFVSLSLPGGSQQGKAGRPSLPVVRRRIAVPYGGDVQLSVHRILPTELLLSAPLVPAQPARRKCDPPPAYAYDAKAYARPAGLDGGARIIADQVWRGVRHVIVEIAPVAYDPGTDTVTLYREVSVSLRTKAPDLARTRALVGRTLPGLAREVGAQIAGLDLLLPFKDPIPALPIHYVLVVADHDGQGFLAELAPLIAWKQEKGFAVSVLRTSEIGTTTAAIKAALRALYEDPDSALGAPAYVVLVGDVQHIPFWEGTGDDEDQAADQYYATMDAPDTSYWDDQVPDFHVGRFSVADAAELAVVVAKTLAHERPVDPEAGWYERSLWVASDDMDAMGRVTHEWVAPGFQAAGMTITNAFKDIVGEDRAVEIAEGAIEEGQSIINYSGHGYHQGWACVPVDNDYVERLPDSGAYPFVITNACQTGQFQYNEQGDCFSEAWLKAPGGAVASWAASNNSLWDEDDLIEKAVWAAFLPSLRSRSDDANLADYPWPADEAYTTVGAVTDMGLQLFYERAPESWSIQYAIEEYNVLGDPSVDLWSRAPLAATVSTPGVLLIGQSEFTVTVSADGAPRANALVALHKDGEIDAVAHTDASGAARLPIDGAPSPGELRVVVTGHNLQPYESSVTVIPPDGAYVALADRTWFDDGANGSQGNGDGLPSPGERLGLWTSFENFGSDPAPGATATLSSSDPCVTVPTAVASLGDLTAGASVQPAQRFLVDIGSCPNGHGVTLLMTVVAGADSWTQELPFTVTNAVAGQVTVDATGQGLAGATLRWSGAATGRASVAEDGSFVLRGLDDGSYTLVAEHPDYLAEEMSLVVPRAAVLEMRMGRPEAAVNPTAIEITVSPSAPTGRGEFRVGNGGDRALDYVASAGYDQGDDAYGYRWSDSDRGDVGAEWVDVPVADRNVVNLGDDEDVVITLPFAFPFYGTDETRMYIGSNGYLNFGASDPGVPWDMGGLPDRELPGALLAVQYEDLNPEDGGQVYWGLVGGRLVVTWDDVPEYEYGGGGQPYTFQAVLSPLGEVRYNYLSSDSTSAIVGLQDDGATRGMEVTSALHDGLSIAIATSVAWVSLTNDTGSVAPSAGVTVAVHVDGSELELGDHVTSLRVETNDIDTPSFLVTLMLHVSDSLDRDGDGIDDADDNCPDVANPRQEDVNDNDVGDACEFPCASTDCDDGEPCTQDTCDPLQGCLHAPIAGRCDDGDACTTDDTCASGVCVGQAITCDDEDPCTTDSCDAAQGCVYTPTTGACDDGDPCTTNDSCASGRCAGVPLDCDDANLCTDDSCAGGLCRNVPNAVACDDGDECTLDDVCAGGLCAGELRDCDDDNICTSDRCSGGRCVHEPRAGACTDGDPCTTSDTCAAGVCSGVPVDCDDGDPCTDLACIDGDCEVVYELPGCCTEAEDCALPFEQCDDDALACVVVQCAACGEDADCGSAGNRCKDLPSGDYCLVLCEVGTRCPEGSACQQIDEDGSAVCLPIDGDCVCVAHEDTACVGGDLHWFDTCGQREEVAEDCAGRGCVDGACCPEDTHLDKGLCVSDEQPVEPGPDVASPDAVAPDAGATDGGSPDIGVDDVGSDLGGDEDAGSLPGGDVDDPFEDVLIRIDSGAGADGAASDDVSSSGGGGGCSAGARPGPPAALLFLFLTLGVFLGRRRATAAR